MASMLGKLCKNWMNSVGHWMVDLGVDKCYVGVRDYGNEHHVFVCLCDETSEGVRKTIEGGYTGVGAGCL